MEVMDAGWQAGAEQSTETVLVTESGEHRFHLHYLHLCSVPSRGGTVSGPRCSHPGCRAWAMHGQVYCRSHLPQDLSGAGPDEAQGGASAGPVQPSPHSFYADAFSQEELHDIVQLLASPQRTTEMEVAVMRVLIRRVMQRLGEHDPAKALPLIRQGVDAICRALRTDKALSGEPTDSLFGAYNIALSDIGNDLGIDQE